MGFFWVESYQCLKNWHSSGYPARCYRVSAGTGRPDVSILWLGEVETLICNFCLSVAAHILVCADLTLRYTSMLLGHWATNKQQLLPSPSTYPCSCPSPLTLTNLLIFLGIFLIFSDSMSEHAYWMMNSLIFLLWQLWAETSRPTWFCCFVGF